MSATKDIFRYLKTHGAVDLDTIIVGAGVTPDEALAFVDEYTKKGIIKRTDDGKYRIKFVLDAPLEEEPLTTKHYDYAKIRLCQGVPLSTLNIPRKWRNPNLQYLPTQIDQGDRGTCVGFSTAIGTTLLYFQITKDFPTPVEMAAIKRDVQEILGCPSGKPLVRDNFGKRWKSPGFIYVTSRIVGNVTVPSGSYLASAVEALKIYGSCTEEECWTSKTPYCVTEINFPVRPGEDNNMAQARIIASAAKRKINGYAALTDFEQFCSAIYTQWIEGKGGGFGLVPIDIFENYTSNGCTGNYPDPSGVVVGSHAQCVVGYDLDEGTLEFKQSWGKDWSDMGGITKRYWNQAAGEAYVILDDFETKVGEELYSRVTINSNVPLASYTINGEIHPANAPVVALERGKQYTIVAIPADPQLVKEKSITITITPTLDETSVTFKFTDVNAPSTGIIDAIIEFLKKIFDLLTLKK